MGFVYLALQTKKHKAMSQNKTVIQGLEPETNYGGAPNGAGSNNNFYSRGNQSSAARGTIVPGMEEVQKGSPTANANPATAPQPRKAVQPGKPVVGFLYSISRTRVGEFWPVQLGKNSIGQAEGNDIILLEGTVSSSHAVLLTRQGKNGIIASIKDDQSTNGTMINGEPLDFGAEECHDGDIITIGNNYELLFVLIDTEKRGLKPAENFIPVEVENEQEEDEDIPSFNGGMTRPGGFDPYNDGPTAWGNNGGGYSPAGGTVGMDGSVSGGNHGGTVAM